MPLDYSKWDNIEDSDEEKPDARQQHEAEARSKLAEELKSKLAGSSEGVADTRDVGSAAAKQGTAASAAAGLATGRGVAEEGGEAPAGPSRQTDRFAHSEADISKLAHETLRESLSRNELSMKLERGALSVASVDKVEGEATKAQIRGENRYIFDLGFDLQLTFRWPGANFDAGPQRAEASVAVRDFTSETSLDGAGNPLDVSFAWTEARSLDERRRALVEEAVGARGWPPPPGSLMSKVGTALRAWAEKLPELVRRQEEEKRRARREVADSAELDPS